MQLVARETLPQLIEEPEPVQRQGLLQALLEGACRLAVDLLQLSVKTGKPWPPRRSFPGKPAGAWFAKFSGRPSEGN